MFLFDNLIVDKVIAGIAEGSDHKAKFRLTDLQNVSLNMTATSKDKTDSDGTLMKRFYTAKNVDFSAETTLFSLSEQAVQYGTELVQTSGAATYPFPSIEEFTVAATDASYTLRYTPIEGTLQYIYEINSNGSLGTEYAAAASASATTFAYDATNNAITLPTGRTGQKTFMVSYQYNNSDGVYLVNSANKFPGTVALTLLVNAVDACSPDVTRLFYIKLPSFQISPEVDLTLDTESTFTIAGTCQVAYCGNAKELYTIYASADDVIGE